MKIHGIEMTKRLKRGRFSKVYLGKDDLIYHLVSDSNSDYSKEAIALFGQCEHSPIIERLENVFISRSGWHYVFRMPLYYPVNEENKKTLKILQNSWENHLAGWQNWRVWQRKSAYEFVMKWFDGYLDDLDVSESIKESIRCIYDSVLNYGDSFLLEFPLRNIKQDKNGKMILLDIVFDTKKAGKQ